MYKREFELAKSLAKETGEFLKSQTIKNVDSLKNKDIKLELDKLSEKRIIETLRSNFDYSILSEEAGLMGEIKANQPYWIIDPIDGTMNYSRDFPFACVSIALWINDEPILGVVFDFYKDELFSGLSGSGAYLNEVPIKTSDIKEKSKAVLMTGFPVYMDFSIDNLISYVSEMKEYKKIRMLGSAALSLCYVACGRADAYREENIKLWDVAAGVAINKAIFNKIDIVYLRDYSTNIQVGV